MNSHFKSGRATASGNLPCIFCCAAALLAGCAGRASLLPNSDPALRKTSTEFAVDASHRFPYKADAPQAGDAIGRAQVGYMVLRVEIVNNSADDWKNVEVWLNQKYVVYVPEMPPHILKQLPFQMFYDADGHYFPTSQTIVKKVEIYMDGKMYNVPLQLAD
jgi:hypothetical protein